MDEAGTLSPRSWITSSAIAETDVKMIVVLGNAGEAEEYKIESAIGDANLQNSSKLVYHAVTKSRRKYSSDMRNPIFTTNAKNVALRQVGGYFPDSFKDLVGSIK